MGLPYESKGHRRKASSESSRLLDLRFAHARVASGRRSLGAESAEAVRLFASHHHEPHVEKRGEDRDAARAPCRRRSLPRSRRRRPSESSESSPARAPSPRPAPVPRARETICSPPRGFPSTPGDPTRIPDAGEDLLVLDLVSPPNDRDHAFDVRDSLRDRARELLGVPRARIEHHQDRGIGGGEGRLSRDCQRQQVSFSQEFLRRDRSNHRTRTVTTGTRGG